MRGFALFLLGFSSLGLSAWKRYRSSRWALRVNPSSGNLHPTESYLIRDGRVFHYAPLEHALEERAVLRNDGPHDIDLDGYYLQDLIGGNRSAAFSGPHVVRAHSTVNIWTAPGE